MWIGCGYAVDNFLGGSRTDSSSGQNSEKRLTHSLKKSIIRPRVGRLKVGKGVLSHRRSKGRRKSGTWHTALYKDVRKVGRGTWDIIRKQGDVLFHSYNGYAAFEASYAA